MSWNPRTFIIRVDITTDRRLSKSALEFAISDALRSNRLSLDKEEFSVEVLTGLQEERELTRMFKAWAKEQGLGKHTKKRKP